MSRRNGNRERVLGNLEKLMTTLADERIEFDEFSEQVKEIAKEHPWIITEQDVQTNVYLLEGIRAKVLQISPVPNVVPFNLKNVSVKKGGSMSPKV